MWYSQETWGYLFNVTKSNEPVPLLDINGISSFSNDNYQATSIKLVLDIEFEYKCQNNSNHSMLGYELAWIVYENGILLTDSETLDIYSFDSNDLALTIDKTSLVIGNDYDFQVRMICTNGYSCDVTQTHSLYYDFSDLVCQIANGNKYVSDVTQNTLQSYSYTLDGSTYSYDPDNSDFIKYEWKCSKTLADSTISDQDCTNSVLSEIDTPMPVVSLENEIFEEQNAQYIYTFQLTMYDGNNPETREECITTSTLTIEDVAMADSSSEEMESIILDISITAASTDNNPTDKLRLIVAINNDNTGNNENNGESSEISNEDSSEGLDYDSYNFVWSELNGYLTTSDITANQINDENFGSNYLILESNSLIEGNTYEFQVVASKTESNSNQYGTGSIVIYVNSGPSVVDGSFVISPNNVCNGNTVYYSSFSDVFATIYDISINANGDNTPLYYQFSYLFDNNEKYQNIDWVLDSTISENSFMGGMFLFSIALVFALYSYVLVCAYCLLILLFCLSVCLL